MNIVILTADESLYLPTFFADLLGRRSDIAAIFCTPPGHGKKSSPWNMARKYRRAFGTTNLVRLARRVMTAKLADRLGLGGPERWYSVAAVARAHGVRCESVENVNDPDFLSVLRTIDTDLIVSVSCPQIFKKPLIDLPPLGCLNIHGAPLPKYRGLLPSFWMMVNGETDAAVTVFFVNEKIDAGEVVVLDHFEIDPEESLHDFILRSRRFHCVALVKAIDSIERGTAKPYPLNTEEGSYFSFPTREAYAAFQQHGRNLW